MITVEEARSIVLSKVLTRPTKHVPLVDAIGMFTQENVTSPHDHPLFDMSAMDGFALRGQGPTWTVVGAVPAGSVHGKALREGECVRIFTGGHVPKGTERVVMQEVCGMRDDKLSVRGPLPALGANIRRRAEQVNAGDVILASGNKITVPAIGLLASCGIHTVSIAQPPRVCVVRTGGEFSTGNVPEEGRIFSSNDTMLSAAIRAAHCITPDTAIIAEDEAETLRDAILRAKHDGDVIITTGGVSVGEHDLVRSVLEGLNAVIHFHGVAQKPGKPMLFATLDGVPVFALPGNPRAVLVLFWEYVLPFLHATCGALDPGLRVDRLPLELPLRIHGGRTEFRAARIRQGRVELLRNEGSHMLASLLDAHALVQLPQGPIELEAGDEVNVHYLPTT